MDALGFKEIKVIALAVDDLARAEHFYRDTLGLAPAFEGDREVGFRIGKQVIMLKPVADGWYARPSAELNPRVTIATEHAPQTEHELRARGVRISDPVQPYAEDGFYVGAFLDSEGNKLWFCSLLAGTLT
ncbi:MAG: VOC family protein [Rhodocyclaceae bacterium]